MCENGKEQKDKPKGFWAKLVDKLDKKKEAKAKKSCCSSDNKGGGSCCS